jgi:DNA-binding HxlR family transcriptional regulator
MALLVERLRRLERMGIVERHGSQPGRTVEYALTRTGRELQRVIEVLGGWGGAGHSAIRDPASSIRSSSSGGWDGEFTDTVCPVAAW